MMHVGRLQEQLARMYKSTSNAVANWNCGDYCVVRDGKNWYRGQVVSVGAATIVVSYCVESLSIQAIAWKLRRNFHELSIPFTSFA